MGLLVAAENQIALNEGIEAALTTQARVTIMKNARSYAENYLDIDTIMGDFQKKMLME